MDKILLEKLANEGLTHRKIAERLDCGLNTVKRHMARHGIKTLRAKAGIYTPKPPLDKNNLEALVAEGLTHREIAERLNRSTASVVHWLKKYELRTHGTFNRGHSLHKCKTCGETDLAEFYGHRKTQCKTCVKIATTLRMRESKRKLVEKAAGKCVRCGYDRYVGALEFHHLDPDQKDPEFRNISGWSVKRQLAEIEKCELLCANCHREAHADDVILGSGDRVADQRAFNP